MLENQEITLDRIHEIIKQERLSEIVSIRKRKPYGPRGILGMTGNATMPDHKIQMCCRLMVEGMNQRAVCRVMRVSRNTLLSLVKRIGPHCISFLESTIVGIPASDIEVDETWTYVFKKEFNKRECEKSNHHIGSQWIFLGIDRASRAILAHHIGKRTLADTGEFMMKLKHATSGRFTVHTDGFAAYPSAIYAAFLYENNMAELPDFIEGPALIHRNDGSIGWLHSGEVVDFRKSLTQRIESFNGNMRMHLVRMARATKAFSKTPQALSHHIALWLCYYNFCLEHGSLERQTPAMNLGLADRPWSMRELLTRIQKTKRVEGADPIAPQQEAASA